MYDMTYNVRFLDLYNIIIIIIIISIIIIIIIIYAGKQSTTN